MTGPSFATPPTPAVTPGAVPSPAAPKPTASPARKPGTQPDKGNGLRILTYLRLHWLMILFCGSLLGTAGAFAAWELLASKYESYALLQVSSAPTAMANQNNPHQSRTDFATHVKTTAALLKSEFVLNAALRDIKDLPTIKSQPDPVKYLDEKLQVSWQDGSEIVRITFKGAEPNDAKKIVDAVQKAFMSEVIQKDVAEKQAFLKKVEDAQIDIKNLLKKQTEKPTPAPGGMVPVGGVAGPTIPGLPPIPGMLPSDVINNLDPRILINRLVALQQDVERLPLIIGDTKRREVVLKEKLKLLKDAPIPQAIQDMIDRDQDVIVEKLRMVKAKGEYQKWLNAGDPNNPTPTVIELKDAYEAQQKRWAQLRQEKLNTLDGLRRLDEAKKIASELEEVIRSVQRSEEQLAHAKAQLATAEKQLVELPTGDKGGLLPVKFDQKEVDSSEDSALGTTDGIYRKLVQQYHLTQMELNSPSRVRVLQSASHPTQKDMKKQYLGTGAAGILGFVLIALGVVAYESVTRRVSSLADVKIAVDVPIVGVIPGRTGRDPAKLAGANEAIDKLRAYASQTWLSRGATTIAVTSPIGDEGKAFAAFGLASSLAQAGYKTLLVDFDLREPALHAYAGVPNLAGACELLRGETDVRTAVQSLPSGLHLLPAGKWSDKARKAATGEKLEGVLAKLKETYDCVVYHGHALLTVAESVEVARRCEVVLVCARYRETATPLLKRAAERVTTMDVPFAGVLYVGASEQESLC